MSGGVPAGLALDNWLSSPYSHWAFQHVEDFMPTTVIARGTEPVVTLPADNAPIADIGLTSTDGIATTVGAVMAATATDGWRSRIAVRWWPSSTSTAWDPGPATCCSR